MKTWLVVVAALGLCASARAGDPAKPRDTKTLDAYESASRALIERLRQGEWCRPPHSFVPTCEIQVDGLDLEWLSGGSLGNVTIKKLNSSEFLVVAMGGSHCLAVRYVPRDGGPIADALLWIEAGKILPMSESAKCETKPAKATSEAP